MGTDRRRVLARRGLAALLGTGIAATAAIAPAASAQSPPAEEPSSTTTANPTTTTAPDTTTPSSETTEPAPPTSTTATTAPPAGPAGQVAGTPGQPAGTAASEAAGPTEPAGTTVLLDSGAWCWFEDERVVIDEAGQRLYVSAVADAPTRGEVVLGEVDMASGARRVVSLGVAELDDHNSAAIWESWTGEVLSAWTRHSADAAIRTHRRRTDGSWLRLPPIVDPASVTYSNLYSVLSASGEAVLYDFYRGSRFDPQAMASLDAGRTWSRLGSVLRDPPDSPGARPYVRYASRGDRIDLIATEDHPGSRRTSVYHGFIRDGVLHDSAGTALGRVGSAVDVTRLTRIATPGAAEAAWTVDIGYDPATGQPIAAYSTTLGVGDHRYHIGRWDGSTWQTREVAFAGRALYEGQRHYTGLMALDPRDPDRVVISTDADPATGAPLVSATDGRRHWELFEGRRQPDGAYAWTPLTTSSTRDNIRPVLTANPGGATAMAWMRGTYTTYRDYSLEVAGVVQRPDGSGVTTQPAGSRLPVVNGIVTPPPTEADAVPVAGDFDHHPADDLLLYRPGTGRDDVIIGDDGRRPVHAEATPVAGRGYRPVRGDFDADGDTDILWYGPGSAAESTWIATGAGRHTSRPAPPVNGTYTPVPGDYDADGDTDILWYAPGTATDILWTANAGTFTSRPAPPVNGTYTPVPGDYDADGDTDVLWYAPGTGTDVVWTANIGAFATLRALPVNKTYTPVAGDFDADGDDDVLWYAPGAASDHVWTASAAAFTSRPAPGVTETYTPTVLDYDGNGADDVLWYAPGRGTDYVWWSGPAPFASSTPSPLRM